MKHMHIGLMALLTLLPAQGQALTQVPGTINYQGRAIVNGNNFSGTGDFKFALVNEAGTATYWSNDGSSSGGAEPTSAVSIDVSIGLFAVTLGDTNLADMVTIPAAVFLNPDVHLRTWLNVGGGSHVHLSPDQQLAAVGYALVSASVVPDAITSSEVADGTITSADIAGDAVQGANIQDGAVAGADIANGSVQSVDIEDGTVTGTDIADGNGVGEGVVAWNPAPGDGKFGGYVSLDGFSGFICDNESAFDIPGKEVTIMAWVRTFSTENWYLPILTKGDDAAYDMELLFGQVRVQVEGVGSVLTGATPDVRDGIWHHLCAVLSPPTNRVYVDGVLYDTGAHNGSDLGLNNSPVGLGWTAGFIRQINGTNSSLTGDMDDAAIFDRALTPADNKAVDQAARIGRSHGFHQENRRGALR